MKRNKRMKSWKVQKYFSDLSRYACMLSCNQLFVTPWSVAHQASRFHGILQARILSRLPYPPAWDLPDSGIEAPSLVSPAWAGGFFPTAPAGKPSFKVLTSYMQFLHQPQEGHNNTLLIHWVAVTISDDSIRILF